MADTNATGSRHAMVEGRSQPGRAPGSADTSVMGNCQAEGRCANVFIVLVKVAAPNVTNMMATSSAIRSSDLRAKMTAAITR